MVLDTNSIKRWTVGSHLHTLVFQKWGTFNIECQFSGRYYAQWHSSVQTLHLPPFLFGWWILRSTIYFSFLVPTSMVAISIKSHQFVFVLKCLIRKETSTLNICQCKEDNDGFSIFLVNSDFPPSIDIIPFIIVKEKAQKTYLFIMNTFCLLHLNVIIGQVKGSSSQG